MDKGVYKGLMTIGNWTLISIEHSPGPMMYASHDCPANSVHMRSGDLTRCHACKRTVPDDVQGILGLYNFDHPYVTWR